MNNYAVSSDGIATALQDSASALMEAGNSLEQATALVAAANKVVQDPSSVGSALRTISLRLRGTSVEVLEQMGEETDGVVESTSKLQEKLQALTGVNILTDSGAYKDTYTILKEIGNVWQDLNSLDQAAALELMAGKNRANTLSAILNNMDDLTGAYESAMEAEGSALRENESYLNSIEGRIKLFTNALQTMWMNFISDDTVKNVVDLGTALIKVVDTIGLLPTAIGAFTAFKLIAADTKNSFDHLGTAIMDVFNSFNKANLSALGSSLKIDGGSILKSIGKGLLAGGLTYAVTAGLGLAMELVDKAVNATEYAIERANNALNEYNQKQEELKDQKNTVDELSDSYARLSSGVNTLTNDNMGLTVDSYNEYLDVCNKIADMYPELVQGYDAQGNAILNLQGKVEGLTASYIRAQEEAANTLLTPENKKDIWTKYKSNINLGDSSDYDGNYLAVTADNVQHVLEAIMAMSADDLNQFYLSDIGKDDQDKMWDVLREQMKEMGTYIDDAHMTASFNSLDIPTSEERESLKNYTGYITQNLSNINKEISDGMSGIIDATYASLIFDPIYQKLDEESKGIVKALINNMNPGMVAKSEAKNTQGFINWFSSDVIQKVANNKDLYSSLNEVSNKMAEAIFEKDNDTFVTAQTEFNEMIKNWVDESGNVVVDSKADVVTQYFQQLAKDIQNSAKNYEVQVEIQTDLKSSNNIDEILADYTGDAKEEIVRAFKDLNYGKQIPFEQVTMKDVFDSIRVNLDDGDGTLRVNEIEDAYQDYLDGDMSDWSQKQRESIMALDHVLKLYGTDLETVIALMVDLGYAGESLENIPSFSFASESINEDIDEFQENIETVRDAWESLNSGDMTKSDFIDLAQKFPEVMKGVDFSKDHWMAQAKVNLEELNRTLIDGSDETEGFLDTLNTMREAMVARGDKEEDIAVLDSFIAYVESLKDLPPVADELQANTITGLTEAYEAYKTIMEETNEVLYNGQKVSDGYYESLSEYIDDTDALHACFDENNKQIVTNVDALKELIAAQKEADTNSVQLAKAQAQLEYYELVRQLGDNTRPWMVFSEESDAAADAILDQIGAIKNAIGQYQLLEDSLLGTTSAFEKFAKAQEQDEQNTYGASYVEMVQTMYDALYKTGEVGSAQFWAAVEANVPADIYQHLTPGPDQIAAISDYLNKNAFSTLTLDEESFSIDYSAIESFVKKAQKQGVFFGTDEKNFGLSADFIYGLDEGENALDAFAAKMGMTTAQVYAMLSEMDKYTADGTGLSMLLQLDQSTTGQITYATSLLERLYTERKLLLAQGADNDALKANETEIARYEDNIAGLQKQATDAVKAYAMIENAIQDTSKRVRDVLPSEIWHTELQLTGYETVEEALQKLKDYQLKLEEPTVMELEIAKQNIEDELADIVKNIGAKNLEANVTLNKDTGLYEINDGTLTVDASTLERYVELMNASTFIDESLSSALTTSEQLLSSIDANVSKIAGTDSASDGSGEETTQNESSQENNITSNTSDSKPSPNTYQIDTQNAINNFMHRVMDQIVSYPNAKNMQQQYAYDELNKIYDRAKELRDGINDLTILPENAYAEFSELQTQAKNFGVEIPVYLDPDWATVDIDEAGAEEAKSINETTEAVDDLSYATQNAASEAEALMEVYASNREMLATLEAIEDKTYALTPDEAMAFGVQLNEGEVLTVEQLINRIKRAQEALSATGLYNPEQKEEVSDLIYTYSQLAEQLTNYNDIVTQTQEIISDGTEVSQEYKDSLEDLGLTTEEISACFEDNNALVVTNAKLLNDLVKTSKNNISSNIKLAKSQAQLKYYDLYKKIRELTTGTKTTDKATLNYVNSLYSQMGAIEQTIAKYSLLEAKLLGATNAYDKLEEAQTFDSEMDYGSKAEEMVNILANAFNTAELGTQAAQVAISGLIPDDIIDKTKTLDEQMQQIYDYFTKGEVSKLFTIEFDDDGGISSVEMTKENVELFTKELIGAGKVFHGTWDEFTLDESITSLDDFAKAIGVTKEVAFAYLTELEKYDINWLGGDYETLLDQLMGDDLEYGVQKTTKKLAQLRKEMAELQQDGISDSEKKRIAEIEAEIDQLDTTMDAHRATAHSTWQAYSEIDNVLADAENMGKKVSDVFSSDLIAKVGLTGDETVKEAYDRLLAYQIQLGEPTELILQLAGEQAEQELAQLAADLGKEPIEINANVKLNAETGEWEYTGDTSGWTDEDKATLQSYLDTYGDLHDINTALSTSMQSAEISLANIDTTTQSILGAVDGGTSGDNSSGEASSESTVTVNIAGTAPEAVKQLNEDINAITGEPHTATVYYLADGTSVDDYIAENKDASVLYTADETAVALYDPADKSAQVLYTADGTAVSEYLPEDKGAQVLYTANGELAATYNPGDKDAKVLYTADGTAVSDYIAENKEAQVVYAADGTAVALYNPEDKTAQVLYYADGTALAAYMPDDKSAQVLYTADGTAIALYDPEDKAAKVLYTADGTALVEYVADHKEAQVLYTANGEAVALYNPDDKTAQVLYTADGTPVTEYIPEDKDAITLYTVDGTAVAEYTPANKYAKVIYTVEYEQGNNHGGSGGDFGGGSGTHQSSSGATHGGAGGAHFANGTAHAQGTAYSGGSWGVEKTEAALVGELGQEIVVEPNGYWHTVGDTGAEFTTIKRGSIVFNHKQSEQLLSNGYITGRGKAYAEGTIGGPAFAGINTWDDAYGNVHQAYSNTGGEELSSAAGAVSDAADEFREVFDWIVIRLEEINEKLSLYSAKLENAIGSTKQNAIIDEMISLNQQLYDNLTAGANKYYSYAATLLKKVPEEYRQAAENGSIAIEEFVGKVDEETLEAIKNYREWVQKGADATQQAEEVLAEIQNLAKKAIDNIAQEYENKASIPDIKKQQLEAYNALLETTQGAESADIYKAMMQANNQNISILTDKRNKMQAELNAQVEAGNIKKGSQAWYDAIAAIAEVDTEIINLTTDTANYQDAINELHWEKFDNLLSRFDAISNEASNLIDILSTQDMVDDNGNWTDEGITSLGLYAQQMEVAEMQSQKYAEQIDYLNNNWQALGYTEEEYLAKLNELKEGQYDSIQAYNDAKDSIVDLTKARVDAIKEGIDEEIKAYEELISKKKEELDAEKD